MHVLEALHAVLYCVYERQIYSALIKVDIPQLLLFVFFFLHMLGAAGSASSSRSSSCCLSRWLSVYKHRPYEIAFIQV